MDNTLIYGIATMGFGFLAVIVRYALKSKCSDVSCCFGLMKIKRDTEAEIRAERQELEMGGKDEDSKI